MPVTSPDAVAFSNTRIRPITTKLARAYKEAKSIIMEWDATAMALEFPSGKGRVVDGSDTDGRSKIFAEDVTAVMTELQSWVSALEADSNLRRNVIIKPSVNVEV